MASSPAIFEDQGASKASGQQVWTRDTVGLLNVIRAIKPLSWSQGIQTSHCALC